MQATETMSHRLAIPVRLEPLGGDRYLLHMEAHGCEVCGTADASFCTDLVDVSGAEDTTRRYEVSAVHWFCERHQRAPIIYVSRQLLDRSLGEGA